MHPEEFFNWWLPPDRPGGKWHKSRWRMTREQARNYPGAERDDNSKEVRWLPDGPEEHDTTGGTAQAAASQVSLGQEHVRICACIRRCHSIRGVSFTHSAARTMRMTLHSTRDSPASRHGLRTTRVEVGDVCARARRKTIAVATVASLTGDWG